MIPAWAASSSDVLEIGSGLWSTSGQRHEQFAARLHRKLLGAGVRRLLAAELCVYPDDSRAGLNGSGIVTINPPWRFERDLHQLLPVLHAALAEGGTGRTRVARLAGE